MPQTGTPGLMVGGPATCLNEVEYQNRRDNMWWLIIALMTSSGEVQRIEIGPMKTQAQCEAFAENWLELVAGPIMARCEQRS